MGGPNIYLFPAMTRAQLVFIAISLFTIIFTLVSLASPGFYRVSFRKYVKYEHGGTVVTSYNYFPNDNGGVEPKDTDTFWRYKKTTIDCALWYFHVCVLTQTLDGLNKQTDCQTSTYADAKSKSYDLPTGFQGLTLDNIYGNIKDIANLAVLEFAVEMPIAFVCMLVGIITEIIFYRSTTRDRRIGLTSFYTHLTSGVLFAVVTGKCIVINTQLKGLLNSGYDYDVNTTSIAFPYCVLLTGICMILCFVCAMKLILVMTNKGQQVSKPLQTTNTGIVYGNRYRELTDCSVQNGENFAEVKEISTN